jgi:hypothetical protein
MSSDDFIAQLRVRALRAQLRHQLWSQDTYWVPEAGWDKLKRASINAALIGDPRPDGELRRATAREHVWVKLDCAALDADAGEKIPVTAMGTDHRHNVLRFIERQVPGVLSGLYSDVPTDPFGAASPTMTSGNTSFCSTSSTTPPSAPPGSTGSRRVTALRKQINRERDARLPQRPVLLGRAG